MFEKYYCPKCKVFVPRSKVKKEDNYYSYCYLHKYCGAVTESLTTHILHMDQKIDELKHNVDIHDLKNWIEKEAIRRYPKSGAEKKAFRAGVYALLDKIEFDYLEKGGTISYVISREI